MAEIVDSAPETEGAPTPSPLPEAWNELGAVRAPLDHHLLADEGIPPVPVPVHFGDPGAERRALLEGAALVDLSHLELLEMSGEDRKRFLNGQVTCGLAELEAGGSVYGFFTSQKGKVQADVLVLALEDRFLLQLPPGRRGPVREHLDKYILVDRVELGEADPVPLAVAGPRAVEVLERLGLGGLPDEEGRHGEVEIPPDLLAEEEAEEAAAEPGSADGVEPMAARALRRAVHGVPAVVLLVSRRAVAALARGLVREGREYGLAPVGWRAVETVRVERGVPRFGADFGPGHFPQETGLEEEAVSYTKGCYLGQEVVARIHYRGGVNRHLRGLIFEGVEEVPAPGTDLLLEGRSVGAVGTAISSPELGRAGLAVLHKRAEPGTDLEVAMDPEEGDGAQAPTARVCQLPFGA